MFVGDVGANRVGQAGAGIGREGDARRHVVERSGTETAEGGASLPASSRSQSLSE